MRDKGKEQSTGVKSKKRLPRNISMSYLQNAALYHLQRYASSSDNLRQVLMRKVRRSAYHHETDETECVGWIEEVIRRYLQSGLLDDVVYTESKVRILRDRGNSDKLIRAKLTAKGIPSAIIDNALVTISGNDGYAEAGAAVRFAKRRRLGVFGDPSKRESRRGKDLAAFARAGFNYGLAQQVVDATDMDDVLSESVGQDI